MSRILADLRHKIPRAALPQLKSEEETKEDTQQLAAGFEGMPVTTFWEGGRDVELFCTSILHNGKVSRT